MTYNPQLPGTTVEEWATQVLQGLNVPVNQTNVDTLVKWASHESGHGNPNVCAGKFNPLNSTENHFGSVCQGGRQGNIRGYATLEQGVANIVHNLSGPDFGYPAIVAGLRNSDQAATFAAIDASNFGTTGLGPGSPIVNNPAGQSAAGGTVGAGTTGDTSSSPEPGCKHPRGCPEGCVFDILTPSILPDITFTRCQGRALLGGVTILFGGMLLLVAVALAAGSSKFGRNVISAVPLPIK